MTAIWGGGRRLSRVVAASRSRTISSGGPARLRHNQRPDVLVANEVGYLPLDRDDTNLAFRLISKRYEKGRPS
ncbi:ATP-binding protein [Streptomyces sp. NPDC055140]